MKKNTKTPRQLRQGQRWRKLSRGLLRQFPLCYDPFKLHKDETVPSVGVHHIKSIESAPTLAYDIDNLVTLCASCHSRVEVLERSGRDTAWLFALNPVGVQTDKNSPDSFAQDKINHWGEPESLGGEKLQPVRLVQTFADDLPNNSKVDVCHKRPDGAWWCKLMRITKNTQCGACRTHAS